MCSGRQSVEVLEHGWMLSVEILQVGLEVRRRGIGRRRKASLGEDSLVGDKSGHPAECC